MTHELPIAGKAPAEASQQWQWPWVVFVVLFGSSLLFLLVQSLSELALLLVAAFNGYYLLVSLVDMGETFFRRLVPSRIKENQRTPGIWKWIHQLGIGARLLSVLLTLLFALLMMGWWASQGLPQLIAQFNYLAHELPSRMATFVTESNRQFIELGLVSPFSEFSSKALPLEGLLGGLSHGVHFSSETLQTMATWIQGHHQEFLSYGGHWATQSVSTLVLGLTSFVLMFYFLLEAPDLTRRLLALFPAAIEVPLIRLCRQTHQLCRFLFLSQLLFAVTGGLLMWLGLTVLQVEHGVVLASVWGLFLLIPVLGPWFGAFPVLMMLSFDSAWAAVVWMVLIQWALFWVKHWAIRRFKKQYRIQLWVHPVTLVVCLLVSLKWLGPLGVLLCLPLGCFITALIENISTPKTVIQNISSRMA